MIGHPNHGVQVSLVDTARELYEKLHRVEDNDTFVTIRADLEAEADFTGITSSMYFHSYHSHPLSHSPHHTQCWTSTKKSMVRMSQSQ